MTDQNELKQLVKNKKEAIPVPPKKDDFKLIGTYKLKDKDGRNLILFKIQPDMEAVVIQKVRGETNKILVAVKVIKLKKDGKISKDKIIKSREIKNDQKELNSQ